MFPKYLKRECIFYLFNFHVSFFKLAQLFILSDPLIPCLLPILTLKNWKKPLFYYHTIHFSQSFLVLQLCFMLIIYSLIWHKKVESWYIFTWDLLSNNETKRLSMRHLNLFLENRLELQLFGGESSSYTF